MSSSRSSSARSRSDQVASAISDRSCSAVQSSGDNPLLEMDEVVELLKTSRPTLYRWIKAGRIQGVKVGRQWRFTRQEVDRFLRGDSPADPVGADLGGFVGQLEQLAEQWQVPIGSPKTEDDQSMVGRAVNLLILLAVHQKARSFHIEPQAGPDGSACVVRCRIDGVMQSWLEGDIQSGNAVVQRLVQMAGCDVLEKQLPQDGQIIIQINDEPVKLRCTFIKAAFGYAMVGQVYAQNTSWLGLEQLPFASHDHQLLMQASNYPAGLLIVAGPAGCGKTTTLHACIKATVNDSNKVIALEDPPESHLAGVMQVAVRPEMGLDYASALRSVLRMDPDVIMIGELADQSTLQIGIRAALSGHLVMSIMHTNSVSTTIKRMADMQVGLMSAADARTTIVSQRLIRKLCPSCSQSGQLSESQQRQAERICEQAGLKWSAPATDIRQPTGCPKCRQTGYKGRTVISESVVFDNRFYDRLNGDLSELHIEQVAVEAGMIPMAADGMRRVGMGETSFHEVVRVLQMDMTKLADRRGR